jgi:Ring finger domain
MDNLLQHLVELVDQIDRRNLYINPHVANVLRRHGFQPHYTYLRPPPPPPRPVCPGVTRNGSRCKNKCAPGRETCMLHSGIPLVRPIPHDIFRCTTITTSGDRCKRRSFLQCMCYGHAKKAGILPPPPEIPDECSICLADMTPEDRVKTTCKHYFHASCFNNWKITRQNTFRCVNCPMCRHARPNPRPI